MANQGHEITRLLKAHGQGDRDAFSRLIPLVYDELKKIARRQLRSYRMGETLNTTALVNETYLKMVDQSQAQVADRSHFFAICARAMRQVIIDFARQTQAAKRGSGKPPKSLDPDQLAAQQEAEEMLDLDRALDSLEKLDARLPQVVECRFFLGLTEQETARVLGRSRRTIQRDWGRARAWLKHDLGKA